MTDSLVQNGASAAEAVLVIDTTTDFSVGQPAAETGVKSAADQAFDELREAAASGTAALEKELVAAGVVTEARADALTPEQKAEDEAIRRRRNAEKAANQRRRGQAELEKTYTGAMSVHVDLKLNDLSVASSAERFLGQIDKGLYVITRQGERAIGSKEAGLILERMAAQIDEFATEAKNERAQVKVLLDAEKAKSDEAAFGEDSDWLAPEYQNSAIEVPVHLKHPDSLKMLRALQSFDILIHDLTILNWNGAVDKARIDQIRLRQNRLAFKVFKFSIDSINGMFNRMGR